jgi:hypothetical protein
MKGQLLSSLIICCATGALAIAQQPDPEARALPKAEPTAQTTPAKADSSEADTACPKTSCDPCAPPKCCWWVSGDYLLWWVKDGPAPTPLVVSGPSSTPLFGGSGLSYGVQSGVQLSAGIADPMGIGLEGNFFILERRGTSSSAASDAAGNPLITLPFTNVTTGAPESLLVAVPGAFAGSVTASSTSQFYGAEAYLVHSLLPEPKPHFGLELLDGFRFLRLEERLSLNANSIDLANGQGQLNGMPLPASTPVTLSDSFGTQNSFFGGQLGARAEFRVGPRFFAELVGKASLGLSRESVTANGASSAVLPTGTVTVPGGLFANPNVLGRRTTDDFAVVPEVSLTAGYQAGHHVRLYVGYNFLYWSSVVRPGDQISTTINPAVVPLFPGSGATPTRIGPPGRESDFWAQGVNFGVAIRF